MIESLLLFGGVVVVLLIVRSVGEFFCEQGDRIAGLFNAGSGFTLACYGAAVFRSGDIFGVFRIVMIIAGGLWAWVGVNMLIQGGDDN
jgi:hypothetical protein